MTFLYTGSHYRGFMEGGEGELWSRARAQRSKELLGRKGEEGGERRLLFQPHVDHTDKLERGAAAAHSNPQPVPTFLCRGRGALLSIAPMEGGGRSRGTGVCGTKKVHRQNTDRNKNRATERSRSTRSLYLRLQGHLSASRPLRRHHTTAVATVTRPGSPP